MSRLKLNILIAGEDVKWTKLLKKFLELANHNVISCHDGFDAICELENQKFDLLILDLPLTFIDGIDIARNVGALNKDTPIFFMIDFMEESVAEYVSKINIKHCLIERPLIVRDLLLKIDSIFHHSY